MASAPVFNPYARPMGRRWYVALAVSAVAIGALLTTALGLEQASLDRRALKQSLAFIIAPYQELFLAGLPGQEAAEYVIFVDDDAPQEQLTRFFAGQDAVRFDRQGSLPGTIVVTLGTAGREGLDLLRAQSFVRLAVRNQGVFFCH